MIYNLIGLGILAGFITLLAQRQQERGRTIRERRRSRQGGETTNEASAPEASATEDQTDDISVISPLPGSLWLPALP